MTDRATTEEAAISTAKAVANFFLDCGNLDAVSIDQLKLQKLVYYAHAWYLGNGKGPLFPDDIEAWPHGPVVRDLYVEFADFGASPITGRAFATEWPSGRRYQPQVKDQRLREFLRRVWEKYSPFSGVQLSNLSHAPTEPWSRVKAAYGGDLTRKPRIPNDLIADAFRARVAARI